MQGFSGYFPLMEPVCSCIWDIECGKGASVLVQVLDLLLSLTTMVGEHFGIYSLQLAKNTLKIVHVGENFEIY